MPLLISLGDPGIAGASCNVIPAAEVGFRARLGAVSTPFARPDQEVVISRDEPAFALDPQANQVRVVFTPPGGPSTSAAVDAEDLLPPSPASACKPEQCAGTWCSCLRFRFPNTDAAVGGAADGHTLAGPATIEVTTDGVTTARIGELLARDEDCRDALFPHFVGLPPPNRFDALLGEHGENVLATTDDAGNLYVPFDFAAVRPRPRNPGPTAFLPVVPFVEAHVPGLEALGDLEFSSFTPEGRRLSATAERTTADHLRGFADGDASVLRVAGGGDQARAAGLLLPGQRGPLVIAGVSGEARRDKWMDATTQYVSSTVAVYENPECTAVLDPGSSCEDLNGDGDVEDHFLRVLDLTAPGENPAVIHHIDESSLSKNPGFTSTWCPYVPFVMQSLGGTPDLPPYALYRINASDSLVEYSVPETACFDLDGDGLGNGSVADGAFDIHRGTPIAVPPDAHRELSGNVLAWAAPASGTYDPYAFGLYVYDARRSSPGPVVVRDAEGRPFDVPPDYPRSVLWGFSEYGAGLNRPFGFAVGEGFVAFSVAENPQEGDLTGDGELNDYALLILDTARDEVRPLGYAGRYGAGMRIGGHWLVAEVPGGAGDNAWPVAAFDLRRPGHPPHLICRQAGHTGYVVPSLSDMLVPCTVQEYPGYRLHVFLPDAPGGLAERDLGLMLRTPFDAQVVGRTLATGPSEQIQGHDLDGRPADPIQEYFGGPFVVHLFDAPTDTLTNLRDNVLFPRWPLLRLSAGHGQALNVAAPPHLRANGQLGLTYFDRDGDGRFSPDEGHVGMCSGEDVCSSATDSPMDMLACRLEQLTAAPCGPGLRPRKLRRITGRVLERTHALVGLVSGSCDGDPSAAATISRGIATLARRVRRAHVDPDCRAALEDLVDRARQSAEVAGCA